MRFVVPVRSQGAVFISLKYPEAGSFFEYNSVLISIGERIYVADEDSDDCEVLGI